MGIVIGIDIGGSTTKICAFDRESLIEPLFVKATDQLASFYGAFGKFTNLNNIALSSIEKVMITGVGSSFITSPPYGLPSVNVAEFTAIGKGGLYLSGLERALVVSMGTGTATVLADKNSLTYMGGTGVGGGTLIGLSKQMIKVQDIDQICELAMTGSLNNVDLRLGDITRKNIIPTLPAETTASNFGKLSDIATTADLALGIINLVFETIGMISIFAARSNNVGDIILTGNLTNVPQTAQIFKGLSKMFGMNFIVPEYSQYGTVIGAALVGLDESSGHVIK